jgi:AcrR family transcriptional regulator
VSGTRDRLVAATTDLFRRQGFNGTSMKQVTEAAGAPTGSLYHFFPGGKDELAAAVIATSGAAYGELFDLVASVACDPASAVSQFFEGAALTLEENGFIDICPIGTMSREVASTNETLRIATDSVFDSWTLAARDMFINVGMRPEDATDLATTVLAALEGGFMLARAKRSAEPLRAIGRNIRRVVDVALAGLN